jgi:uncharacterized protein YlxW (UPF0749 family)
MSEEEKAEPAPAPVEADQTVALPTDVPEHPGERETQRKRRVSAAGAMIGVLLALLGFTLVAQVRSNNQDTALASARPEDLIRILSDLDARAERLRREMAELEDSKRQLESGAQGREAALTEARRRAEVLGILAGTLPAEGPGIEVTFTARDDRIKATSILDAVEELRGAGAEAMQIVGTSGSAVRVVAGSYFVDSGDSIDVDGLLLTGPYRILAIGDPPTMQTALTIPGGVVDDVRQRGGTVTMRQPEIVRITALHNDGPLRYARPA